jgi:hypothetical protein
MIDADPPIEVAPSLCMSARAAKARLDRLVEMALVDRRLPPHRQRTRGSRGGRATWLSHT